MGDYSTAGSNAAIGTQSIVGAAAIDSTANKNINYIHHIAVKSGCDINSIDYGDICN